MSLRTRLVYLMAAVALFVVVAATVTIYGTQWHISDASGGFGRSMAQTGQIDRARVAARSHILELREIVEGRSGATRAYLASQGVFLRDLEQVARFARTSADHPVWEEVLALADGLRTETARCIELVNSSHTDEALILLNDRIEGELLESLTGRLLAAKTILDENWNRSVGDLVSTNTQVLVLAIVVGALAAGLLVVGARLIHLWLIVPISKLREATQHYGDGDLGFRVSLESKDELGELARAMNSMAASLEEALSRLHSSEAKYRALFENQRDAVFICDQEGVVIQYHDGDTGILGHTDAGHVGRHFLDAWPALRTVALDWAEVVRRAIESRSLVRSPEVAFVRDGGTEDDIVADVIAYPIDFENNQYAAVVLRDVTERERLQKRIRHAARMEATGTLAGGIAHDFNNLLTSAIGTLSLLGSEVSAGRASDLTQSALQACWQAANLSRRLLDFASGGQRRPQTLRLREMVELVLNSLDETALRDIRVSTECKTDVLVKCDRDQLTQIILNLVRNACDAMPHGGELGIYIDADTAEVDPSSDRRPQAILTVKDTGGGMAPEVSERIFEPFFSTKARGPERGRGLGLAIVYAAVKSAGGSVHVESQLGKGTTFRIYLPVGEGVPEPIEPPTYDVATPKGEGTILVVDDDPMIVKMCASAMQKWGYSVITAASINEASQVFGEAEDHVSVALIDINLPDGSGVLLAQDLVTLSPQLRIIFATGYSDTSTPPELDRHVCCWLSKPFALDELSGAITAALSRPAPSE